MRKALLGARLRCSNTACRSTRRCSPGRSPASICREACSPSPFGAAIASRFLTAARTWPRVTVFLMGTSEAIAHVQQRLNSHSAAVERITIVGGGDVGFRLAQRLEQRGDADVWVIERDQARGEHLAAALKHALVLVSVIDNDERNLDAANFAVAARRPSLPYSTHPE
jgi:hypothetical protein